MTCVVCHQQIKTESEEFEEVGSIEFAHVECVDKQEARKQELNAREEALR